MVVNESDAKFYSKLNTLNIKNFGFNKIFPGNMASSMIPVLSNSTWMWQACNQTSEILKTCLPNSRWSHTAAAHMKESGMSELFDTGNQQSNKEVDWQKVLDFFKWYLNTKYYLKVHVFEILPIPGCDNKSDSFFIT